MDGAKQDGAGPDTSVIVASFSGRDSLVRCLDSLACQSVPAEVIVATDLEESAANDIAARFPAMRIVRAPLGTSVFRLRSLGIEQASGRIIALTEDHCAVAPEWVEILSATVDAGHPVVGGPVDNGLDQSTYGWSLYFCEYLAWMSPVREGPTNILTGVNVAYDRGVLAGCRTVWQTEFHENEVNDALRAAGYGLHLTERACVRSHLAMGLASAMGHLYSGGRQYGNYRRSDASALTRALRIAASPAVPLVLIGRVIRRVAARRPALLGTLLLGFPYLVCLLGAWSLGEAIGYVAGAGAAAAPQLQEG